jgi:predicted RNA-binding protein with TRAM domain
MPDGTSCGVGDGETRRWGDKEMGRQGDGETRGFLVPLFRL